MEGRLGDVRENLGAFKSDSKALEGRLEGVEEDFIELKIDI